MPNDFFKHNDKVYAENLNDGILVGNSFNFTVDISLPSDTGDVFPSNTTMVKAKVADVTPSENSNLSIGEIITNNSGSSQDYRLTVYPNFNRFGGFRYISVIGEDCTIKICEKGENTEIVSGLDYDDLSNIAQLKILKEYDIVISIGGNKTLTRLDFGFISREKGISATIDINDVNGLNGNLTNIRIKNTEQDSRLSILEANNYDLSASNYNPTLDDDVTITCKCSDINGNPVANKSLQLYNNSVLVSSKTTNSNGVATWTITLSDWDNHHFVVGNVSLDLKATGYLTLLEVYEGEVGSNYYYKILRDETTATLIINNWETDVCDTSKWETLDEEGASTCRPMGFVMGLANNNNIVFRVTPNGKIEYRALKQNMPNIRLWACITWQIRESDL